MDEGSGRVVPAGGPPFQVISSTTGEGGIANRVKIAYGIKGSSGGKELVGIAKRQLLRYAKKEMRWGIGWGDPLKELVLSKLRLFECRALPPFMDDTRLLALTKRIVTGATAEVCLPAEDIAGFWAVMTR